MTINPDLHPDDAAHIRALAAALRTLRIRARLRQDDIASSLRAVRGSVTRFERGQNAPHISAVQRHARAVGHIATLRLHRLTWAMTADMRTHAAVAASSRDLDVADESARTLCLLRLVAARRDLGLTRQDVTARMGSNVTEIEAERYEPLLSTYQRYARALGGRLTVELKPTGPSAAVEYRARRLANATLRCGTRSARLRHAALGQTCRRCGVGYEPLPDLERAEVAV